MCLVLCCPAPQGFHCAAVIKSIHTPTRFADALPRCQRDGWACITVATVGESRKGAQSVISCSAYKVHVIIIAIFFCVSG